MARETDAPPYDFTPLFQEDEESIRARLLDPFLSETDPERQMSIRQGGFLYDLVTTAALELTNFYAALNQAAAVAFLVGASGDYLDQKGVELNRPRLPATYSATSLTFEAPVGTVIPAGSRFSTAASGDENDTPIEFSTAADVTIGVSGQGSVAVVSTSPGAEANVPAAAITQMVDIIQDLSYVTNDFPAAGGADEETDDTYRGRLISALRAAGGPGSKEDYRDWAREIAGVGDAIVFPHWAGGGTVKVVLIGPNLTVPTTSVVRTAQDYLDPSVALLSAMETDEGWTGATFVTAAKSEGSTSIQVTADSATTTTAELVRDEHLDYINSSDVFSAWVDVTLTTLANLDRIRFRIVDDANLIAYKEFLPSDLSAVSGGEVKEWTLAQMTVPVGFDWSDIKKFQVQIVANGSGAFSARFDAWRITDADGAVGQGRAPVGAQVTVASAKLRPLYVSARVVPAAGASVAGLKPVIFDRIQAYLTTRRSTSGFLYLSEIANVINDTPGVLTYYDIALTSASEDPNTQTPGLEEDLVLAPTDVPILTGLDVSA